MNICAKFHSDPSTKYGDIASRQDILKQSESKFAFFLRWQDWFPLQLHRRKVILGHPWTFFFLFHQSTAHRIATQWMDIKCIPKVRSQVKLQQLV